MSANEKISKEALKEKVLEKLPTLPKVVQEAWKLMERPNVSPELISEVIGKDITLTAKILRLINSPFYGFPNRIGSLKHAIILLGFNTIRGLLISSVLFGEITPPLMRIWEHACECATTAGIIARQLNYKEADEITVAGLLHDMSKVVLKVYLPEIDAKIEIVKQKSLCLDYEAEKEVMGFAHDVINLWLAEQWHFPPSLTEALAYHHTVEKAKKYPQFAAIINLADVLIHVYRLTPGMEVIPEIHPKTYEILNIFPDFLLEIIRTMDRTLYNLEWGIDERK
ncbi:MAG TPA: HDOD domain-containing protein [Candidatus Desulfofervidus auxilii]|uniref:HDOD domain-containing protein n=1 Tax=Desulfofervidus auxilii TaxID=1621989 RepID=A0A7C0Y4U6_DESA2|nr:HDOD domain-containing protein [Candidatus Desulfofervidus auxilii]